MGLEETSVKFVCAAKSHGVDFGHTLTLGRQGLYVRPGAIKQVFAALGVNLDASDFLRSNTYAEKFFHLMGAECVESIDMSSYEGATHVHDLNLPIPNSLRCRYSVVYDGGTLEHVFNLPQALKNCMEMVRVGGHFLQSNCANNFMGHGFWQFSPELLFRTFSESNGFRTEAVLLHEILPDRGWISRDESWYAVSDPDELRQRVELRNSFSTGIVTIAKRIAEKPIFDTFPMQADYQTAWEQHARNQATSAASATSHASKSSRRRRIPLPSAIKRPVRLCINRLRTSIPSNPFHRPGYTRICERDFLRGKFR